MQWSTTSSAGLCLDGAEDALLKKVVPGHPESTWGPGEAPRRVMEPAAQPTDDLHKNVHQIEASKKTKLYIAFI